jgi:hypothetical protein
LKANKNEAAKQSILKNRFPLKNASLIFDDVAISFELKDTKIGKLTALADNHIAKTFVL